MTRYRLSDHSLAIETGRHRQTWLPREDRLCQLCPQRELETEEHFLLHCNLYDDIRATFFTQILNKCPNFHSLSVQNKMQHILGEHNTITIEAAKYVNMCHNLRDMQCNVNSV